MKNSVVVSRIVKDSSRITPAHNVITWCSSMVFVGAGVSISKGGLGREEEEAGISIDWSTCIVSVFVDDIAIDGVVSCG